MNIEEIFEAWYTNNQIERRIVDIRFMKNAIDLKELMKKGFIEAYKKGKDYGYEIGYDQGYFDNKIGRT